MASNSTSIGDSNNAQRKLPKVQAYCTRYILFTIANLQNREFYFHIREGNHLNITRADMDPLWKDIPEVTSANNIYHTIQCAEVNCI